MSIVFRGDKSFSSIIAHIDTHIHIHNNGIGLVARQNSIIMISFILNAHGTNLRRWGIGWLRRATNTMKIDACMKYSNFPHTCSCRIIIIIACPPMYYTYKSYYIYIRLVECKVAEDFVIFFRKPISTNFHIIVYI